MNLLRESNMQLREENKHNFEECQVGHKRALIHVKKIKGFKIDVVWRITFSTH